MAVTGIETMKVSVAMITYNHEKYIAQAIESILSQDVRFDYEIVIGEDLSTDRTRAVVMDFQRRYPDRIRLLLRDHNVGSVRNFADTIEACQGEYLALLEGDDYWICNNKLQMQVDFLDAHPEYAICCGRARTLYESDMLDCGRNVGDVLPALPAGRYTIDDMLTSIFAPTATVVLRRRSIPPFPQWFLEMKMGDWPLFALTARSGFIQLMDEVLSIYRIHAGGLWTSMPSLTGRKECIRMLTALDKELQYRHHSTVRATIARLYLLMAATSRSQNRWIDTAKYLFACVCNGGWRGAAHPRTISGRIAFGLMKCWSGVYRAGNALIGPIWLAVHRQFSDSPPYAWKDEQK